MLKRIRLPIALGALVALSACYGSAKDAVRRETADPDAVQFRDIRKCGGNGSVITGKFNAKNAYGAYVGFRDFYYEDGKAELNDELGIGGRLASRCIKQGW